MLRFTPENWFWIIGGDESRFWSSAANAYVSTLPPAAGVTRILNEAELIEALARLGMPGPPIAPTVANLLAYAAAKRFEV
uniref:hypothetical protein n=1 Tax=Kaistia sp. MMO-174 TaxID=3081256 RepID=UPI003017D425